MKKATWFIFFLLLAVSCLDEPDCFQLNNNTITIAFKLLSGETDQVPLIGVQTADTDSIFYPYQIVNTIIVPLNVLDKEIRFFLENFYGIDTLDLAYDRQIQYVSEDCGERYVYSNLRVLGHSFDSLRLVNTTPAPETSSYNNIIVYRCPRTNLVGLDIKQILRNGSKIQDTITLTGEGVTASFPTPILLANDSLTSVYVPLDEKSTETTITFYRTGGDTKTLTLTYKVTMEELYDRCGEQPLFSELQVKATTFTSATLIEDDGEALDSIQDPAILNLEIIQ